MRHTSRCWVPALLLLGACSSCSGAQVTANGTANASSDGSWTVGVNVAINLARAVLPVAKATIDAQPNVAPEVRQGADRGFDIAGDSLNLASTALATYTRAPTIEHRCQVHFYVDQAITGALQGVSLMRRAGANVPPQAQAVLGSLGLAADVLYPGCQGDAGEIRGMRITYQARVQNALY